MAGPQFDNDWIYLGLGGKFGHPIPEGRAFSTILAYVA